MTRIRARILWLIVWGDTTMPRCILACVAGFWSLALFAPGNTFERPVYAYMAAIASELAWASAWGIYSMALAWRTFSAARHRTWLTLAINVAGVALFVGSATCIVLSPTSPVPAGTAPDVVLALVSVWLLMRSGLNNPPGWRGD